MGGALQPPSYPVRMGASSLALSLAEVGGRGPAGRCYSRAAPPAWEPPVCWLDLAAGLRVGWAAALAALSHLQAAVSALVPALSVKRRDLRAAGSTQSMARIRRHPWGRLTAWLCT